jgi:hypothetical protein
MSELQDFVAQSCWVAWRNDMRDGKLTKLPYCAPDKHAEADDPSTWLTHDRAAALAQIIVNGTGGGVGIELGRCGDIWLAGVDLDTCRDQQTGAIVSWATDVLDRLDTYAETSPSGSGVKALFLINPADIGTLRTIMDTQHGRQFKRANGADHPPAIELYISNRYFAVTWERLDDAPTGLRAVPLDDLRWLIKEAGPAFSGKARAEDAKAGDSADTILARLNRAAANNRAVDAALRAAATLAGGSRSEGAFGLGVALKRSGWSFEDMKAALLACPATREWATEKLAEGARQFHRIWERAAENEAKGDGRATAPPLAALWCDTGDWTEADISQRPWVAPGYLLRGTVTLLTGPPSVMKSSLVLAWACSLALRRDFSRFHPNIQAPIIVYNVEDDAVEQRRRLSATLRQFGAVPADIRDKVVRTGPSGIGTLLIRDDAGRIRFTPAMERLEGMIRVYKPAALVLDPLSELHGCEENDNTALRAIIARFRELAVEHDIAVVILHHTRKGGASPGDPDSARGASAIIGAVRIALTLSGMSEDDARTFGLPTDAKDRSSFVRLDDAKQNYHAIRDAEWFQKMPHRLDNGEIVPAAEPWSPPKAKTASQFDLAALAEAIKQGSPTPGREPYSPKMSEDARSVRQLLVAHGFSSPDAQKACMTRLMNECGVKSAPFKSSTRKTQASGLHIDFIPTARWVRDGNGDGE